MSVDIEARVRRANLLSRGEQLEQLFDDELSHRLLRDIYAKKEGRMSDTTDRPQPVNVEEIPRRQPATTGQAPRRSPVPGIALAGILTVVTIGVVLALVAREPEPVADTPVEIAEAFMAAVSAHDIDTVVSMLAEDATHDHDSIETLRGEMELQRILGRTYDFAPCLEAAPGDFTCPYQFSNEVFRALGAGPYSGVFQLTISEGMVSNWTLRERENLHQDVALPAFASWMEENHPEDDLETLHFHYFGPETLTFWEKYLPEFVASVSGN